MEWSRNSIYANIIQTDMQPPQMMLPDLSMNGQAYIQPMAYIHPYHHMPNMVQVDPGSTQSIPPTYPPSHRMNHFLEMELDDCTPPVIPFKIQTNVYQAPQLNSPVSNGSTLNEFKLPSPLHDVGTFSSIIP
jgi:hypothetical protein